MRLIWIPSVASTIIGKEVAIYNFGSHTGFLVGNDWRCYHILERHSQEDGGVEETVELTPDDYVPRTVYSVETYPITAYSRHRLCLSGWTVEFPQERSHQTGLQQPPKVP